MLEFVKKLVARVEGLELRIAALEAELGVQTEAVEELEEVD